MVVASGVAAVRACAAGAGASAAELVQDSGLTVQLLGLLGLGGDPESDAADVVLAHVRPAASAPWQPAACDASAAAVDALLRTLLECPDVAQRLYVVLLLGRCDAAPEMAPRALPAHLSHLRPTQSFSAQLHGEAECVSAVSCRRVA